MHVRMQSGVVGPSWNFGNGPSSLPPSLPPFPSLLSGDRSHVMSTQFFACWNPHSCKVQKECISGPVTHCTRHMCANPLPLPLSPFRLPGRCRSRLLVQAQFSQQAFVRSPRAKWLRITVPFGRLLKIEMSWPWKTCLLHLSYKDVLLIV